jgi:hypothetical protein
MATSKKATKTQTEKKPLTLRRARTTSYASETADAFNSVNEIATQVRSILVTLPDQKRAPGDQLLSQLTVHAIMRLRARVKSYIAAGNVDIAAPDTERAKTFLAIVREAVLELDGSNKDNVVTFLVRTAWHEGSALTKRVQSPSGPARSFMQMEPGAASDGVKRAKSKGWLDSLATASGNTASDITSSAAALSLGKPWPAGNLIEEALRSYDLFGVELARAYLSASSSPIPTDLDDQADYWESEWHRVPDPTKKAQWLTNAKRINKLLGWS